MRAANLVRLTILFSVLQAAECSIAADQTMEAGMGTTDVIAAEALQAVPFSQVKISDSFWLPRLETNRTVSLPHSLEMLEKAGNIKDLELAAAGAREGYMGPYFIDSDLYKALEAISYSLASHPDPELEQKLDAIIAKIAAAQEPDGYLNTWVQVTRPGVRWKNLRDQHELYCAGHLIEAAVAHHQATGKRTLLDVAIKFADNIDSTFGDAPGKRMGYPGHQELELALIKLWRITGEQRYYDLARFFMENRGTGFFATEHGTDPDKYNGEYWMDNARLRDHRKIVGHAVRSVYLLSAATDYAAVSKDAGIMHMLNRIWKNTTGANMYVTGGIGSSAANEGFTHDYDLPNFSAYQETCASVAMIMWNHRMGLLTGNAKFADFMERTLYNGFLAGVALDGKSYFYVNPLASRGKHHRKGWYSCACCPPNVTRTLAQLGGYAYATTADAILVNLFIQGSMTTELSGKKVGLEVVTDYPWSGEVRFKPQITSPTAFQLRLRIPEWSEDENISVNGDAVTSPVIEHGYAVLDRTWKPGDEVVLNLPLEVKRIAADPRVKENAGRLAIQRGPLVYCLEGCDHDAAVHQMALPRDAVLTPEQQPDLLSGVVTLAGQGTILPPKGDETEQLYSEAPEEQTVNVKAIPYYAWDNREAGDMAVWIPTSPPPTLWSGPEGKAEVSMSFASGNCMPNACRDGIEPEKSSDKPSANCHFWPHKGTEEWVQYDWAEPQAVSGARVFWFDDTGSGECRIPAQWHIEYKDGDKWTPVVETANGYPTELDRWCEVEFETVKTTALRLVVQMQPDFAAGIHEWQIIP